MTDAPTFHPRRWAALVPLLFVVFLDMVDSQIVTGPGSPTPSTPPVSATSGRPTGTSSSG